jgi:hypothetical protein
VSHLQGPVAAVLVGAALAALPAGGLGAKERVEHFDEDPGWDGQNNRAAAPEKRTVRQDFGYSPTEHAGGKAGEVGGFITPAAETAYYARKIEPRSLDDALSASGRLACKGRAFHALIAFFNAQTAKEWRTPNSIAIRLLGRGDVFYAYVEYATGRWRAGGDSPGGFATARDPAGGKQVLRGFRTGVPLEWSLRYDPKANKGAGAVTVTLGGETAVCDLAPGHRQDGATFNRFGLLPVLKSADGGGEVWLDDVAVNGAADDFARDPKWEGVNNRREYVTADVRPRFDFGYSETQLAGGKGKGELGGLVFRGDCRFKAKLAAYGDRLEELTLEKSLRASGKVALRRAVSDSTTLIGFYHSEDSLEVNPGQGSGLPKGFLGMAIEGPSREGFLLYPAYRVRGDGQGSGAGDRRPHILPDGKSLEWHLNYEPTATSGELSLKVGDASMLLPLKPEHRKTGARFNRFGIVTTWVDGNGQRVYFDDLTYTCGQ